MRERHAKWDVAPLGEVAPIDTRPVLPAERPEAEFNYIALENIESGTGRLIDLQPARGAMIRSNKFLFDASHVLLGKLRPYLNKVVVPSRPGICSTDILPLLPKAGRLSREWLAVCLRSPDFVEYARANMDGAKMPRLRTPDLETFEVPIPPLAEQRRLVARIYALTSRLEQARQARQAALADAEALIAAQISALFQHSDCWRTVKEGVCSRKGAVRNGPFGSQLLHKEFTSAGVAAIGTRDVQTNRFELRSGWYVTPAKFEEFRRYQVFPGDILCTIVGASIGRFCVVPEDVPLAFTTKHIQALSLDTDAADPRFVSYMLNFHPRCRDSLFAQVEGSAQPSLNAAKVLSTDLPLPPVKEQRRIAIRLDQFAAKLAELQHLQRDTDAELAAFTPALLAKAFRGEL